MPTLFRGNESGAGGEVAGGEGVWGWLLVPRRSPKTPVLVVEAGEDPLVVDVVSTGDEEEWWLRTGE